MPGYGRAGAAVAIRYRISRPASPRGSDAMRLMLMLYENDAMREAFFGPGSEPLGAEIDALLRELRTLLHAR